MEEMCKFIYAKDLTDRLRTRSMLCQIYHQALHDRWYQARDLMLMSHLQDTIQHSDVPTQVRCYKLRYSQNQDEQWDIFMSTRWNIFCNLNRCQVIKGKKLLMSHFFLIKCNLNWRLKTARRFTCSNRSFWKCWLILWSIGDIPVALEIVAMYQTFAWEIMLSEVFSFLFFLYVLTTDILHVHVYFTDSLQQDNGAIRFVCIQKRKY